MSVYGKQVNLIKEKEWDCLIILDACRFDFFREVYKNYLDGELYKVISEGSQTSEWVRKTFRNEYFEAVYVSANPYVNSSGIKLSGLDVCNHFEKIIDGWEIEWDDETMTVPPAAMGKLTRLSRAKYPDKRIISHFLQPHTPYLSLGHKDEGFLQTVGAVKEGKSEKNHSNKKLNKIKSKFEQLAFTLFGWKNTQKIKGFFHLSNQLSQTKPSELVARKYGNRKLRAAYRKNLEMVLSEISELTRRLPGEIVVTSDHGELLGEEGVYGHYRAFDHPILKEVPWLEVT